MAKGAVIGGSYAATGAIIGKKVQGAIIGGSLSRSWAGTGAIIDEVKN
jgi:hypothetical protein